MSLRRWSLRTHLFAAIGAIVVVSVGITLAVASVLTRREVQRSAHRDLVRQADLLAERERVALLPFSRLPELKRILAAQHERVEGPFLRRPSPYLPESARARLRRGDPADGTITVGGTTYFFAAQPVRKRALVLLRTKQFGASESRPYLEGLLIAGLVGAALAALASLVLARWIARPVRRVAEASRSVGATRVPDPVPVEGAAELATLAASFNDMARQLEKARAAEQQFLLSVSHELKTPLTAVRGYAEGLGEGAFSAAEAAEPIRSEAARLERLVGDLLDLARMNKAEFSVHREPIDLADAAREAVRRYETQARAFGVELDVDADGAAPALGDADRVMQVVSNLVENALRLTPAGGSVRVVARPRALVVEDTGPGLRPEELPRAFDRFYLHSRYGKERPVGTGLGLAIVKELVHGMGGDVTVESEPDRRTRFVVTLPAAPGVLRTADTAATPA
jgi:signal transduction histidine kinase